jgi:hypothetical protein
MVAIMGAIMVVIGAIIAIKAIIAIIAIKVIIAIIAN